MAANENLHRARMAKNDEFYTQYYDIEAEMNAYYEYDHDVFRGKTILCPCDDPEWSNFTKYFASNFKRFGLKKLISTSYAGSAGSKQLTLFEENSPLYDKEKHDTQGKIFTLTGDTDNSGIIDVDDIMFSGYLEGDGDFRSEEVTKLRDEADVIITNPPFSLFREFLAWIMEGQKQFAIMGNKNAITYKEVFPLLKENIIWTGYTSMSGGRWMILPDDMDVQRTDLIKYDSFGHRIMNIAGVMWFTNLDHGKRHRPTILDTMAHNLKFNKKLKRKLVNTYDQEEGKLYYPHYDNYDAVEVPFTECIPSNYDGVMGVPISFLDKYCPEQFEIIDARTVALGERQRKKNTMLIKDADGAINGKPTYARILIHFKKNYINKEAV